MKKWFLYLAFVPSGFFFAQQSNFSIPYETFQLNNGLTVILHEDHSDPVVAVNLTVHVGSAREKEGRTGFAHLFEHLLFLESENLGKGGLDILSANIGGSGANGSTSRDRTNYLQTVPKDALEKMIWAEADKLGWFINTVTDPVLEKEKQVVKNEKRQSYDNNAYGHTMYVHGKAMYPKDHPYNWEVIGSLEDLDNATLEDVKEFYRKWYVPNNVVLVIAGDINVNQTKEWVKKYFEEIPQGAAIDKMAKRPALLRETVKLYHEDNFARVPALMYSWPTVERFHPDSYPLQVLTKYLTEGKNAPFYKVLVEENSMTDQVDMFNYDAEIAGETYLNVTAYPGFNLNQIAEAIEKAFAKFEKEGISDNDLSRIKAQQEVEFYESLSDVLGKSENLAEYFYLTGNPGYATRDIQQMMNVSRADVMRVYNTYFKNKPYVATSFVPKGQTELMLAGSEMAEVVEEPIIEGAEEDFDTTQEVAYEKTPSKIKRDVEPPYGEKFTIQTPKIDEAKFKNGFKILAIENDEVPLVQFQLLIDGGQKLETVQGAAAVLADQLMRGTAYKTAAELEDAIAQLGSSISVSSSKEHFVIQGVSLKKNFKPTMQLLSEVLLAPRWDEEELAMNISSKVAALDLQKSSANTLSSLTYNSLLYGENHVMAKNALGTESSLKEMKMQDLKDLYTQAFVPQLSLFNVVGDITMDEIKHASVELIHNWKKTARKSIALSPAKKIMEPQVYFVDFPDAKQSVIRVGAASMPVTDKNYYNGVIANYIFGGGGFASILMQELREAKGYTYGVHSSFNGRKDIGSFDIATNVRSNVTLESMEIIKKVMEEYPAIYEEEDLETTKGYLIKSQARNFETHYAKLNVLQNVGLYGLPKNYVAKRQKMVEKMTVKKVQAIAKKYINPKEMIWVVTGDAKTQKDRIQKLGYGSAIEIKK